MTNPRTALVVLSGGQDSTTCLFWAKRYFNIVHAVTFDYCQRHSREIDAARKVAALAGVASHEVIELGPILKGASPLTDPSKALETYPDYATMDATIGDRVELTFVPMRNALFLNIAANRAAVLGAGVIVTGVCQADNANYPDCRSSFIGAQADAIKHALGLESSGGLTIATPLMYMSKAMSIELAEGLEALGLFPNGDVNAGSYTALAFSHTAYDGKFPPVGNDHASVLRAHGFEQAMVPDPLVVRAWHGGHMALPQTANYNDMQRIKDLALKIDAAEKWLTHQGFKFEEDVL